MTRPCCVLVLALGAAGCGSSEPTGVKDALGDREKQQLKELNEQRQQEWGSTNAKEKGKK